MYIVEYKLINDRLSRIKVKASDKQEALSLFFKHITSCILSYENISISLTICSIYSLDSVKLVE